MNILITGGAGYVGTELAHILTESCAVSNVTIYDNLSRNNYNLFLENQFNSDKISYIDGDILDGRRLRKALDGIDVVFHLAAKVTTPYADQDLHQYEQVNHWGTTELVSKIEKSDVQHVVYLSSASVYGFSDDPFDEDSLPNPTNHYGITKKRAEDEIMLLKRYKKINIVRSANVFGYSRSMRFDSVINRFMFDANFNGKINVFGDGRQFRAFVSVKYLVELLYKVVVEKIFPEIINAVEYNYSINELIFEHLKALYPKLDVLYVNQEMPVKSIILKSKNEKGILDSIESLEFDKCLKLFKSKFSFR